MQICKEKGSQMSRTPNSFKMDAANPVAAKFRFEGTELFIGNQVQLPENELASPAGFEPGLPP
jgi:hypothetical protein